MIGVVVWSNADREKAVIWCEDQGALAYLQGRENMAPAQNHWPDAGDLLELDTEIRDTLRLARRVSLISERHCPALPEMLRQNAAQTAGPQPKLRLVSSQPNPQPTGDVIGMRSRSRGPAAAAS